MMTMRALTPLLILSLVFSPTIGTRSLTQDPMLPSGNGPTDSPFLLYLPLIGVPGKIQAPVLKWQGGGCYNSWCETGWYSSPAAGDLDGDGRIEIVAATYSVVMLDGATGALEWRFDPPGGRVWPGVALSDINGDGSQEIISAQGDGYVNVLRGNGTLLWSRQPTPGSELRSLAVSDLDGNGKPEILVASTRSDNQWFVYDGNGSLQPGSWPQLYPDSTTNGWAAGCYNENVGVGDLDGDGRGEIIGPSDVHYITAYEDDGRQILASSIFGLNPDGSRKYWSQVGVHVDQTVDLRGYAYCGTEHRPNFANSAPILADLDGKGHLEVVVVGNVYNCIEPYTDLYEMPFIFNPDRTRWSGSGYDWTALPIPDGFAAPLSEDYNRIENSMPNPVAADLDGDGRQEILYASYDGRVHAYWLDKTEHGHWPFQVNQPGEGFLRFASEPVVADLNNDGLAEVIFASWTEKDSNHSGRLYILDAWGTPLYIVDLPFGVGETWNGSLAAPTLADINSDHDLEVVLNTAASGVVAYDLPGTAQARILWGTGRGSYLRTGSVVTP